MLRRALLLLVVFLCALAWGQGAPTAEQKSGTPPPKNPPPPRSEPVQDQNESSSRDTQIDIHDSSGQMPSEMNEGEESADSDVQEMRPYDPHRAEHNVEVGDYLMRRKSYRAAESRYREALEYKPNDAIATFRLAVVLEKTGELDEARQRYQEYLKVLPQGPFAAESRKALARLKPKKEAPKQASRATSPPAENHP
ncbi:MAG TPA: tetratricopeptide repeat protein [Terriglobales bacterium]|nr:tetratricopeptide repeat protein [Terriglobales bacterium]